MIEYVIIICPPNVRPIRRENRPHQIRVDIGWTTDGKIFINDPDKQIWIYRVHVHRPGEKRKRV